MSFDQRLTPARPDLAAEHLRGHVDAPRYATSTPHRVRVSEAMLFGTPNERTELASVLLFGESFDVYEIDGDWAWGQAPLDRYVGYIKAAALRRSDGQAASHYVKTLGTQVYGTPELKVPPIRVLPFASKLRLLEQMDGYGCVGEAQWIAMQTLAPIDQPVLDWVATAEQFLGVPYVWGGRSSTGIDCSGLVQLAIQSGGRPCPRDSDMQLSGLGEDLAEDAPLQRGDLLFWKGHVGIMRDGQTLLHANAHHMAVESEPLDGALTRIGGEFNSPVIRRARLDATGTKE